LGDPAALLPDLLQVLADPELEASGLPTALAGDVDRFRSGMDGVSDGSWFGIATALAMRACIAPSGQALTSEAERLPRAPWWVTALFDEACAKEIRAQPHLRAEWCAVLGAPPELPRQPSGPSGRVAVYQPTPEWTIEDPFELWDEEGAAIQLVASHAPLRVLRILDPDVWFRAVDAWDDARLVCAALWGDEFVHDRAAIIDHLRVAAAIFGVDGSWTRRTAAIVLAHKVLEHARALAHALRLQHIRNHQDQGEDAAALSALMNEELPAFFSEAWEVLLGRSDGLAIAAALYARLSAPLNRNTAWREYDIEPTAAGCLARVLAGRGTTVARLRELWIARREMPRQPRNRARRDHRSPLCAISGAVEIAAGRADQIADLFSWFAETLSPLETDWSWFATTGALQPLLDNLAVAFASDASTLARCEDLYAGLEPQRRLSEFGRQYAENSTHEASVIVLGVILQLIDRARVAGAADLAPAADRTFEWAARLALVSSPGWESPISTRLALVYAIVIRALVNPTSLGPSLRLVLTDPGLTAHTVARLIPPLGLDAVESALKAEGVTLRELEVRAEEWSVATGLPDDERARDALREFVRADQRDEGRPAGHV
jgi:hypothetical protein